jgi:hypothetical protein
VRVTVEEVALGDQHQVPQNLFIGSFLLSSRPCSSVQNRRLYVNDIIPPPGVAKPASQTSPSPTPPIRPTQPPTHLLLGKHRTMAALDLERVPLANEQPLEVGRHF